MAKKRTPYEEALIKLQRYCAYQDRCHQEVRGKLLDLEIYGQDLESIMAELIAEDFLNEERFARSFARGKFRIKGWGKIRIAQELKRRKISDYCLRKALEEIEDGDYEDALRNALVKKIRDTTEPDLFKKRNKVAQHVIRKGFEPALVWEMLKNLLPENGRQEIE